ncbi:hypothetical protein NHF46_04035 [Arthrobacter alpinus]|nr:hypothetical protein [Arthrobacter alpinus]
MGASNLKSGQHLINTIGSLLVPVGALAVAPLVARGLGAADRGYFASDQALMIVVSAAFAIGLSDAVAVRWLQWNAASRRRIVWLNASIALLLTAAATIYMIWSPSRQIDFALLAMFVLGCWTMTSANFARGIALAHSDILGVGLDKIFVSLGRLLLTAVFLQLSRSLW